MSRFSLFPDSGARRAVVAARDDPAEGAVGHVRWCGSRGVPCTQRATFTNCRLMLNLIRVTTNVLQLTRLNSVHLDPKEIQICKFRTIRRTARTTCWMRKWPRRPCTLPWLRSRWLIVIFICDHAIHLILITFRHKWIWWNLHENWTLELFRKK